MNNLFEVGDIISLKVDCLGNIAGSKGVCYETYELDGRDGASFVFENGNYDGFSPSEQEDYLSYVGFSERHSLYQFSNVMKLSRDFDSGLWKECFQ